MDSACNVQRGRRPSSATQRRHDDGGRRLHAAGDAPPEAADLLGQRVAAELQAEGADEIIRELRS